MENLIWVSGEDIPLFICFSLQNISHFSNFLPFPQLYSMLNNSFYCREIDQIKREIAIRKRERVSITLLLDPEVIQLELGTAQRKSHLCIPGKEIARPQSQFPYSCFCDRFLYSHDRSTYTFLQQNRQTDHGNINRYQKHECRHWDWGRAVSFLGIFVSNFRYTVFAVWSSSSLIIGRGVSMDEIIFLLFSQALFLYSEGTWPKFRSSSLLIFVFFCMCFHHLRSARKYSLLFKFFFLILSYS